MRKGAQNSGLKRGEDLTVNEKEARKVDDQSIRGAGGGAERIQVLVSNIVVFHCDNLIIQNPLYDTDLLQTGLEISESISIFILREKPSQGGTFWAKTDTMMHSF